MAKAKKKTRKRHVTAAALDRSLSAAEVDDVLKAVHRALSRRGVHQNVRVNFASAASSLCWERVCEVLPNGEVSCHWVQKPC
jgi:hypothetical protein